MDIIPFKERKVNPNKPVQVYRCLVRSGNIYSIKQDGYVVGHTEELTLKNVNFHVNQKGRGRCLKQKTRNVHAWVTGTINDKSVDRKEKLHYNPYKANYFRTENQDSELLFAEYLTINKTGVFI